jgi:putative transposase
MCALFRNKYRIGSKRYHKFDYSSNGKYFVTTCTKNKIPYFGKIENGKLILSELGICLQNELLKTPSIRPDMNITIDEFVVMPDHFHAIIIIGENRYNQNNIQNDGRHAMHGVSTKMHGVSTKMHGVSTKMHGVSTITPGASTKPQIQSNPYHNIFAPQLKNLSSIIRGVKSVVTIYAKINKLDFQWQPRFHDHIIRTNTELIRIRKYIIENPQKWNSDPHNFRI